MNFFSSWMAYKILKRSLALDWVSGKLVGRILNSSGKSLMERGEKAG